MKKIIANVLLISCIGFLNNSCTNAQKASNEKKVVKNLDKLSKAYFASGCFWCVEAVYERVKGVEESVSGYSGGKEQNPTYESTGSGQTGHAETVEIYYDPKIIDFKTLVKVFYGSQDPTTVGQKPDFGSQYRSIIFYQNEAEKNIAEAFKDSLQKSRELKKPIVTEILSFEKFWVGEDYHQDYERINPMQPYILGVSIPRLKRFEKKFPELLK